MNKIIFILFTLFAFNGYASDEQDLAASTTKFKQLEIDPASVQLVSSEHLSENRYFKVVLEFMILPKSGCQENYAGLLDLNRVESTDGVYTVVYAVKGHERCRAFGRPRNVRHELDVTVVKDFQRPHEIGETLKINGNLYHLSKTEDNKLKLEWVK